MFPIIPKTKKRLKFSNKLIDKIVERKLIIIMIPYIVRRSPVRRSFSENGFYKLDFSRFNRTSIDHQLPNRKAEVDRTKTVDLPMINNYDIVDFSSPRPIDKEEIIKGLMKEILGFNYWDLRRGAALPIENEKIGMYLLQSGIFYRTTDLVLDVNIDDSRESAEIVEKKTYLGLKGMIMKSAKSPLEADDSELIWLGYRKNFWPSLVHRGLFSDPQKKIKGLYANPDAILTLVFDTDTLTERDVIDGLMIFGVVHDLPSLEYRVNGNLFGFKELFYSIKHYFFDVLRIVMPSFPKK